MSFTNRILPSTHSSSSNLQLSHKAMSAASSSICLEEITTRMSQIPLREELENEPKELAYELEELDYEPEELDYEPEELDYEPEELKLRMEENLKPTNLASISSENSIVKIHSVPFSDCSNSAGASGEDSTAILPSISQQSAPKITFNPKRLISADGSGPKEAQHSSGEIYHSALDGMNDRITANVGNGELCRALPERRSSRLERRLIVTNNQAKKASDETTESSCDDEQRTQKVSFDPKRSIFDDSPNPLGSQCFSQVEHSVLARMDVCETADIEPSSLTKLQYSRQKRHLIFPDKEVSESQSRNTDACKINTDADCQGNISQPEITPKRTTQFMLKQPKVNFSPSSLIFTTGPVADTNLTQSIHDTASGSFQNSKVTNKVSFKADELEVTEMVDELAIISPKRFKQNQEVVPDSASYGLPGADNSLPPSNKPCSILKKQQPYQQGANEKIVSECLELLCKTTCSDKHQSLCRQSAAEVFTKLCFDQFFQNSECFSSSCDENHHYKPHSFTHPNEQLWYASVYVILYAAQPNHQIVENLIQHYAIKGNRIETLAFAKCISRVRRTDRLELAHYIINILSGKIPRRDIITVMLMMNFSELSTFQYTSLMEGLGVFEQNTTHYSELMGFLNFREYLIPVRLLVKVMGDAIDYLQCKNNMVESIAGFLRRLPSKQIDEVQSIAGKFSEKFGISFDRNYGIEKLDLNKKLPAHKRRIQFATEPHIREFEVVRIPIPEGTHFDDRVSEEFSDDENPDTGRKMGFSDSRSLRENTIVRVFGESYCTSWMLAGDCPDPVCSLLHCVTKESLVRLPSDDVYAAAVFIADEATSPSIDILKVFIEYMAESQNTAMVLRFRKCASKLSTNDSLALTNLVISLLAKQIGHWAATEKVMVPDIINLGSSDDNQFLFDQKLIQSVMSEAVSTKTSLPQYMIHAIFERVTALPPSDPLDSMMTAKFIEKFVLTGRKRPPCPNILPIGGVNLEKFDSHLKLALYQGVANKYFLAAAMLKVAIGDSLREQAIGVSHTFLLTHYDRARILTQLLGNCRYFDANDKESIISLLGTVGLNISIRLYEEENIEGTVELFVVLKTFNFDIFSLLESVNMTEFDLAVIYCSVIADTDHRNDTIDVFLEHCVGPTVKSSVCPPKLVKLTASMFRVFTSRRLVEESFKLFNGIVALQGSSVSPLNIVVYLEPTLRCAFHRPCDDKLRRETLKLFVHVIDPGLPVIFQKVTYRSVFLTALMEIASLNAKLEGHINIIHPLVKNVLMKCISEGAYPEFSSCQITLFSSMTVKEIKVYVLWWFVLYVRARKRQSVKDLPQVNVVIVQDRIHDDSTLPIHHSLRFVNDSITGCAERLASFIRHEILPVHPYDDRGRGVLQLHQSVVLELMQTSIDLMNQHGYIDSGFEGMCAFCFDKLNVKLSDKL